MPDSEATPEPVRLISPTWKTALLDRSRALFDAECHQYSYVDAYDKARAADSAYARSIEQAIAAGEELPNVFVYQMTVAWLRHVRAQNGQCPGCGENDADRAGRTTINGFPETQQYAICPDCHAKYYGYFISNDADSFEAVLTHTHLLNA